MPLRAGIEVERLFAPDIEDALGRGGREHGSHDVILRPVILVAGGVREDFANGHLVAASEPGKIFADRIVERELALLLKHQDRRRSELLGDGPDGVAHVRRGGHGRSGAGSQARFSKGLGVHKLPVLNDGNGGGRNAGLLENLRGDAVDATAKGGLDGIDSLRGEQCGEREDDGKQKASESDSQVHSLNALLLSGVEAARRIGRPRGLDGSLRL